MVEISIILGLIFKTCNLVIYLNYDSVSLSFKLRLIRIGHVCGLFQGWINNEQRRLYLLIFRYQRLKLYLQIVEVYLILMSI